MTTRLCLCAMLLSALATAAAAIDLTSYGLHLSQPRQENDGLVYEGTDERGTALSVLAPEPLSESNARALGTPITLLEGWSSLRIDHLRATVNRDGSIDLLVAPASFTYKGTDLRPFMPSGLQFHSNERLSYDFRMVKNGLFLRMSGQVSTEEQFADHLLGALANPALYLQTTSPDYLPQRIDELVTRLDAANARLDALSAQLQALQLAIVTLNNRGFFGNIIPISTQDVDALVELKKANPSLDRDQAAARLKEKGIALPAKVIELVFGVYFNEFPK